MELCPEDAKQEVQPIHDHENNCARSTIFIICVQGMKHQLTSHGIAGLFQNKAIQFIEKSEGARNTLHE